MHASSALVRYRRPLILAAHAVAIPAAYVTAFAMRFDLRIPAGYWSTIASTIPILIAVRLLVLHLGGVFSGYFRFFSLYDLVRVALALAVSSMGFAAVLAMTGLDAGVPRSIYFLDWAASLLLYGCMLLAARELRRRTLFVRSAGRRTLVVGAGAAAAQLLTMLRQGNEKTMLVPVGLVDDAAHLRGRRMYGVRVLGTVTELPELVKRTSAELIVLAIPSASPGERKRVVEQCIAAGVEFKTVPSLEDLLTGKAPLDGLRDVRTEELLGRDPVSLDIDPVRRMIAGRVVLVTGGAGSIGSELARQLAALGPSRLVLFEQAESPLYFIHHELRAAYPELDVVPVIGSVADAGRVEDLFGAMEPEVVFHAAAYKHVPLMEGNVGQAVRNNVLGTMYVADAAVRHGVQRFVLISTDKAVNPSSVMGATKRVAERVIMRAHEDSEGTDFRAVRFGNVLGSNGSVIPLFQRQLAEGRSLTVTHPDVTRYFMTIPEAVALVLQSAVLPEATGRICMLDMGEPVRIAELAERLVRLAGLEPHVDVAIEFTGLRPGEKLHEELTSQLEAAEPTSLDKVRIVRTDEPDRAMLDHGLDRLTAAVHSGRDDEALAWLRTLVPEHVPPLRVGSPLHGAPELPAQTLTPPPAGRPALIA